MRQMAAKEQAERSRPVRVAKMKTHKSPLGWLKKRSFRTMPSHAEDRSPHPPSFLPSFPFCSFIYSFIVLLSPQQLITSTLSHPLRPAMSTRQDMCACSNLLTFALCTFGGLNHFFSFCTAYSQSVP